MTPNSHLLMRFVVIILPLRRPYWRGPGGRRASLSSASTILHWSAKLKLASNYSAFYNQLLSIFQEEPIISQLVFLGLATKPFFRTLYEKLHLSCFQNQIVVKRPSIILLNSCHIAPSTYFKK